MSSTSVSWIFLFGALTMPVVGHTEMYKWMDQKGVTNYSNKPPPNARATKLDEEGSKLSTVHGVPPRKMQNQGTLQTPLQREALQRGSMDQPAIADLQSQPSSREQCFAERRVDCDSPTSATYDVVSPTVRPLRFLP